MSSKKKSTTYSTLPDGSTLKEYTTEQTHPDNTKTITTTSIKTYKVLKVQPDGSKIIENISSTTTTTKEVDAPIAPNVIEKVNNGLWGILGYTPQDLANSANNHGGDCNESSTEDSPYDDMSQPQLSYSESLSHDEFRGEALNTWGESSKSKQRRNKGRRTTNKGRNQRPPTSSRSSRDSNSSRSGREKRLDTSTRSNNSQQQQRQGSNNRREEEQVRIPTPLQYSQHQTSLYNQQKQQQQQQVIQGGGNSVGGGSRGSGGNNSLRGSGSGGGGFFTKTHPTSGSYHPNNNNNMINQDLNYNNNNGYAPQQHQQQQQQLGQQQQQGQYMLYEDNRCSLPTYQQQMQVQQQSSQSQQQQVIIENKKSSKSRSLIRSLTPNRSRGGSKAGSKGSGESVSSRRSFSSTGSRRNKMGISLRSSSRGGRSNSQTRGRQGQRSQGGGETQLDPEVMNAISMIRNRSKSPVRSRGLGQQVGMRRSASAQPQRSPSQFAQFSGGGQYQQGGMGQQGYQQQQGQQQGQGQQQLLSEGGSHFTSVAQSISRQFTPTSSQNGYQQQQGQAGFRQPPSPRNQMYQQHPHDGSLQMIYNQSPGGSFSSQQQQQTVDFDGLPLGQVANPIQGWDDYHADMRDDMSSSQRGRRRGSKSSSKQQVKDSSKKNVKNSSKKPPASPLAAQQPAIPVKYNQALLSTNEVSTSNSPPQVVIHKTNAILTSDKYVHFYSYISKSSTWIQTTTVSLPNTHHLSLAICNNTAVVGVPYDTNVKGVLTGSAYIFEKDNKTRTWYQVKKIVPKKVKEYATVGYSVDICDNVVVIGVPELGSPNNETRVANYGRIANTAGCGSIYVYQRAEQYKWMPMGHLSQSSMIVDPFNQLASPGGLLVPPTTKFGSVVALRHKIMVVSNYTPNNVDFDTSLFVYEYDPSIKNKWRLIQSDLLHTMVQRKNFGSHIALTNDGSGIFIGCHTHVTPTEILFYKRKKEMDMYGNRNYQLEQIITIQDEEEDKRGRGRQRQQGQIGSSISDFRVDGHNNFILGISNSNRVYVYQQIHDLTTMENQGWRVVSKVMNDGGNHRNDLPLFGQHVGMYGDNILVGARDNVYSYSLEKWMALKNKKGGKKSLLGRSRSSSRGRFKSPMKFRS